MKTSFLKLIAFTAISISISACKNTNHLHDQLVSEHRELEKEDSVMEIYASKAEIEHAEWAKVEASEAPSKNEKQHKEIEAQHEALIAKLDSISKMHAALTAKHAALEDEHLKEHISEAKMDSDHVQMMVDHAKMKAEHATIVADYEKMKKDHEKMQADHKANGTAKGNIN